MVQSVATPGLSPATTKQGDKDSQCLHPAPTDCSCRTAEETGEASYCSKGGGRCCSSNTGLNFNSVKVKTQYCGLHRYIEYSGNAKSKFKEFKWIKITNVTDPSFVFSKIFYECNQVVKHNRVSSRTIKR